jgi:cytochrome b561
MMTKRTPHQIATTIAASMIIASPREQTLAADPAQRFEVSSSEAQDRQSNGHRRLTKVLHWGTIPAILIALAAVLARDWVDSSALRKELLVVHQTLGMTTLAIFLLRYGWRFLARLGGLHRGLPLTVRLGAVIGHYGIYISFIALCILGWLTSDALGRHPRLFGYDWLPSLIRPDRELGDRLQEWHLDMAWIVAFLVVGHVAAALWHHFVRRDRVLLSMLPSRPLPARRSARSNNGRATRPRLGMGRLMPIILVALCLNLFPAGVQSSHSAQSHRDRIASPSGFPALHA